MAVPGGPLCGDAMGVCCPTVPSLLLSGGCAGQVGRVSENLDRLIAWMPVREDQQPVQCETASAFTQRLLPVRVAFPGREQVQQVIERSDQDTHSGRKLLAAGSVYRRAVTEPGTLAAFVHRSAR